jgi:rubrerythrin
MATNTRATATTETARTDRPTRPAAVDPVPTVVDPVTSATTTSRAVPRRAVVRNRRLTDGYLGESFLVWRCLDCGETGSLDAFPAYCPDCRADRESLFYWVED